MLNASKRQTILSWASEGKIQEGSTELALQNANAEITSEEWAKFSYLLLVFSGISALCSGVIFFFAYNWDKLGNMLKFGLVETAFIVTNLIFMVLLKQKKSLQTAALIGLLLLTGAMLALIGQTYQTGADPWQLFALWFALTLPWLFMGQSSVLWILGLILGQTAITLYFTTFRFVFWFGSYIEVALILSTIFLGSFAILLEILGKADLFKNNPGIHSFWSKITIENRYAPQFCVLATGFVTTFLAIFNIVDKSHFGSASFLFYIAWLAVCLTLYRYRMPDLTLISGSLLSLIVVITTLLARILFANNNFNAGIFLILSIAIVGQSTAATLWIKKLHKELHSS